MGVEIVLRDTHSNMIYGKFTTAGLATEDLLSGLLMECKFRYDKESGVMPHFEINPCTDQIINSNFEGVERHAREMIIRRYTERVNCFRYHLELIKTFPDGIAFYDGNHVLTMINGRFYDKRGMVMYPMKDEPRIYEQAHEWGDTNDTPPTVEERLEVLERMVGAK